MSEVVAESSLDSQSREERIAARRTRIEARLRSQQESQSNDEETNIRRKKNEDLKDPGKSKSQIAQSKQRVDKLRSYGTELITNVRVAGDARESARRHEEEKKLETRRARLEEEIKVSAEKCNEMTQKWATPLAKEIPQELNEMMTEQQSLCDSIIESKNKLIQEFQHELKSKDDEYVKDLKRQADDIDLLLERMDKQIKELQRAYREELTEIEKSFLEERISLMESNRKEIEALMKQRRDKEQEFMETREKRVEENESALEQLRVNDAEEYNMIKIKLETDVQVLEQQLQAMKATYQLNSEKLEYNFQVLKKRDDENQITITQQKRKITRMTDVLNNLRAKYAKQERTYREENMQLTDDYARITEQFKELQKKFRHFESADGEKYSELWAMNQEQVLELVQRVLEADKVLTEQQLGLRWRPPSERVFDPAFVPSHDSAPSHGHNAEGRGGDGHVLGGTAAPPGTSRGADGQGGYAESVHSDHNDTSVNVTVGTGGNGEALSPGTIKRILELLCDETGFLVEEKLTRLLAPLDKGEQSLMKLDSIFKALSIHTEEDIHKLASYFIITRDETEDDEMDEAAAAIARANNIMTGKRSDSTEDNRGLPQLIHPNDVVRALRAFVQAHGTSAAHATNRTQRGDSSEVVGAADENEYWDRLVNIISPTESRIWAGMLDGLEKYNSLLSQRWELINETDSLRTQNDELRTLLSQYMTSKVNQDLRVPPTRVMGEEFMTLQQQQQQQQHYAQTHQSRRG
eukprot:Opistho-2@62167